MIEWTDLTQNPVKVKGGGNYCEKISPGCAHCYASGLNSKGSRFGGNGQPFGGIRPEARPEMVLNVDMLQKWPRMRKSKKIFVGSMTDIFGEWIPDWMIFSLFDAMAAAPRQTFQILTKRPERASEVIAAWLRHVGRGQLPVNIWLGVSAENQATYDERVKWLSRCLAQVRFLSLEPLLDFIELAGPGEPISPINWVIIGGEIDWIIIGGESGSNARPLYYSWISGLLAQSRCLEIPVFIKQLGSLWASRVRAKHRKGGDPEEWPPKFRVRMFPEGKKNDS